MLFFIYNRQNHVVGMSCAVNLYCIGVEFVRGTLLYDTVWALCEEYNHFYHALSMTYPLYNFKHTHSN